MCLVAAILDTTNGDQWFSTGDNIDPHRGHLSMSGDIFGYYSWKKVCCRDLVGRNQGRC